MGRAPSSVRYYLYISDAKLDMLFEQIEHRQRRRISAEVKVDLKLASLTLRSVEDPAPARAAKLRIVERFIERHHQVGAVGQPDVEYVRGSMLMRWGHIPMRRPAAPPEINPSLVFFKGEAEGQVVMLAGSRHHMLGESPTLTRVATASGSDLAAVISAVATQVRTFGTSEYQPMEPQIDVRPRLNGRTSTWLELIDHSFEGLNAEQRLEFLAVPLLQGPLVRTGQFPQRMGRYADFFPEGENPLQHRWAPGPYQAMLATPLYVALAPPAADR